MASVGCSLMEAYNVPSFQTSRRRKGCVVDTAEIKASSEPYESYMDSSHEMALWKQDSSPQVMSSKQRVSQNPSMMREGFENRGEALPKNYSGYVQDKNYYCKQYNICPETFTGMQVMDAEEIPQLSQNQTTSKSKSGASKKPKASCPGPLQPPKYEYPMSAEARSQYDKALQLSLNQETGGTVHYPSEPRKEISSGTDTDVTGYTDEDLDQFLKTNSMKNEASITLPTLSKQAQRASISGRDPYASKFAESMSQFMKDGTPKLRPDGDSTIASANVFTVDPWDRVWDMALFVVAGLLIILLLEQLFKLAMLYGMKRAFLAIEPLLAVQKPGSE